MFDSIYRVALSPAPASFLFDSPTVHVHGYYLGTDKIDHFFQQGHEYFELVMKNEAEGADAAEAIAAAVAHGVKQEHKYYGTLASGVYSNGDLAANYAGMKFYLNLRHPVRIGERSVAATARTVARGLAPSTRNRSGSPAGALPFESPRRIVKSKPVSVQPRVDSARSFAIAATGGCASTPIVST